MWAAVERCSPESGVGGSQAQCSVDVAAVVQSVLGVAKYILKALKNCGAMKITNHKCMSQSFFLGENVAGLSKAISGIALKCTSPNDPCTPTFPSGEPASPSRPCALTAPGQGNLTGLSIPAFKAANCFVNVKNSMDSVVKATVSIMSLQKDCESDPMRCTDNSLYIVSAVADLAAFLLGAVQHCSKTKFIASLGCGQYVTEMIGELADIGRVSSHIMKSCARATHTKTCGDPSQDTPDCKTKFDQAKANNTLADFFYACRNDENLVPFRSHCSLCCGSADTPTVLVPQVAPIPAPVAPRLYSQEQPIGARRQASNSVTLCLVALLPITAVVGFFGGRRFSNRRRTTFEFYDSDMEPLQG